MLKHSVRTTKISKESFQTFNLLEKAHFYDSELWLYPNIQHNYSEYPTM